MNKKLHKSSLVIFFLFFSTPGLYAFSGEGKSTLEEPYEITSVEQLQEMKDDLAAHYILMNDIDASDTQIWSYGEGFTPVGDSHNPFTGSLDGQGFTISELYIDRPENDYLGLFGRVENGNVSNLKLERGYIKGKSNAGAVAGGLRGGMIINCSSDGIIKGCDKIGGLAGYLSFDSRIYQSYSSCNVYEIDRSEYAGGLFGYADYNSSIEDSYSTGDVSGTRYVGGLAGSIRDNSRISNCYSTGNVSGPAEDIGGLVGNVRENAEVVVHFRKIPLQI